MSISGRNAPLSPISVGGSEWPASKYPEDGSLPVGRGNLVSPPVSAGSNPVMSMNGFPSGPRSNGGAPSPPASIGRSSMGTGPYARSESGRNSTRTEILDDSVLSEHYIALRAFLNHRDSMGIKQQANKARDKLLRLSSVQFYELSTDVYDELMRRQATARTPANAPPPPTYLLPEKNFHPKRNQARQRLSSLGPPRFRDLAADVFHELERRFPRFVGGDIPRGNSGMSMRSGPGYPGQQRPPRMRQPSDAGSMRGPPPLDGYGMPSSPGMGGGEFGRPMPKQMSQSNTMVPNKSTMVEEDDDGDSFGLGDAANRGSKASGVTSEADRKLMDEYQSQITELKEKLDSMEDAMKKKEDEMNTMLDEERSRSTASNSEKQEIADLKLDLENKLEEAQSLNDSMKQELDRVYEDHAEETRQLRDQVAVAQSEAGSGSTSADADLQQENDELRVALREQQQVTEEVRQEAQVWLKEMRALSQQSEARYEKQVELEQTVDRLEHEVREWRNRYSRAKTQVRSMRASVLGLPIEPEAANLVHDQGFTSDDGLVKDVHVTRYQTAIDELLQRARKEHPEKVTDAMKSVVVTVRRITKDVDETTSHDEAFLQQKSKLKAKVSSTANHLITASKNYAAGAGLSPVSLVDAAASHLTAAIVELLRGAKIRPTPSEELEEDDDDGTITPVESAGFFSPRTTTRASSMHQENAPPPPPAFQGLNGMRASVDSSTYSPIQSPRESMHPTTNGYGYMNHKDAPPMTNGYGNYHQTADVHNGYDFS